MKKRVVYTTLIKNNPWYEVDSEWATYKGVSRAEIKRLGEACLDCWVAEMADSYMITSSEQRAAKHRVKDLLDKYNLEIIGSDIVEK